MLIPATCPGTPVDSAWRYVQYDIWFTAEIGRPDCCVSRCCCLPFESTVVSSRLPWPSGGAGRAVDECVVRDRTNVGPVEDRVEVARRDRDHVRRRERDSGAHERQARDQQAQDGLPHASPLVDRSRRTVLLVRHMPIANNE